MCRHLVRRDFWYSLNSSAMIEKISSSSWSMLAFLIPQYISWKLVMSTVSPLVRGTSLVVESFVLYSNVAISLESNHRNL